MFFNPCLYPRLYLNTIRKYQKKINLNQLIQWLGISKTSYYRWIEKEKQPPFTSELDLEIQKICQKNKYYNCHGQSFFLWGYRKVFHELIIHKWKVNVKTVYRKMKKFHMLCQTLKNRYFLRKHLKPNLSLSNLIQNNFQASSPFQKISADFTYLPYGRNQMLYFICIYGFIQP